jgi:energy-coupling factor transport system ATP-binding protein
MAIELNEAGFEYWLPGGKKIRALSPITLSVSAGEFVAVLGATGSGKTTLGKLINGLILATSGEVAIDGLKINLHQTGLLARRTVGTIFQNPDNQLVATTVEDDVAFGPENMGIPREEIHARIDEALAKVDMEEYRNCDPHQLSAGQKQRVAIAGALAMCPRYLVLDEPTSLLDPRGRREVLKILNEIRTKESVGIVYITHIIEEAVTADRVLVLKEGKLVAFGSPRAILSDASIMLQASLYSPKPNQLARLLAAKDVPIATDVMTEEEVVKAICLLN